MWVPASDLKADMEILQRYREFVRKRRERPEKLNETEIAFSDLQSFTGKRKRRAYKKLSDSLPDIGSKLEYSDLHSKIVSESNIELNSLVSQLDWTDYNRTHDYITK